MLISLRDPRTAVSVLTYAYAYVYAIMGFLRPFGSNSEPHQPTAPSPPAIPLPPATEAHIYSLAPVGRVWYVQLHSGIPDQLSPFEFGNSTIRKLFATMTPLGHHAKTLHSAYPPTPLPQPPFASFTAAAFFLSYAQHPPLWTWG